LVLAEQERIVQMVLSEEGTILDCVALRRKYHILDNLLAEVDDMEETGEFAADVEFLELETDVGWYGRQCRRIQRNQLGESTLPDTVLEDLQDLDWLDRGGPQGTNFCTRKSPRMALWEEHLGENRAIDKCCLALQQCSEPLMPLEWVHGLLNPGTFPLFPCTCLNKFLQCLPLSNPEAVRLARLWGSLGGDCYTLKQRNRCEKYDTWFSECLAGNTTEIGIINNINSWNK